MRKLNALLRSPMSEETISILETPKSISLCLLVLVNLLLVFAISYSRSPQLIKHNTKSKHIEHNSLYLTSTAVALSEALKLIGSLVLEFWSNFGRCEVTKEEAMHLLSTIKNEVLHIDTVMIGVPGLLYVVENNLLFIALSHISVGVYEVTDQVKILTTAVFSTYMLSMRMSRLQKLSLIMLTVGVGIVEFSNSEEPEEEGKESNQAIGISSVLLACLISGFAGVYFEKIVKHGRKVSIFIRNIQLAIYGVCFGILSVFIRDESAVEKDGFFQGYNFTTWLVIILFAVGGVINALVIKYANNILKGFAASIATVLTSIITSMSADHPVSNNFILGSSMVVMSVVLYGTFPASANNLADTKLDTAEKRSEKRSEKP